MTDLRVRKTKTAYVPAFDLNRVKPLTLEDIRSAVFDCRKAGFTEAAVIGDGGMITEPIVERDDPEPGL